MRGADALVRTLAAAGVRHVFALSGNHVMPVFDAALDAGIALVHTRHEAAAVHMADAWARITGEPGVALVTGGPGHANAVGALYTALMAESPVVLLSGHAPRAEEGRGAFQEMAQAQMAGPVVKASWTCAHGDDVARDVARALRTACEGRPGPVSLSVTVDALEHAAADAKLAPDLAPVANVPPVDQLRSVVDALRGARRPLLLAGPAWCTRRGRARLAAVEATLGVPCIGQQSPRGVNDPALGCFAEVLAAADFVLLLGKRLDFTLGFGRTPPFAADCRFAQVDPDAFEIERTRRAVNHRLVALAVGDAAPGLAMLEREAAPLAVDPAWHAQVREALAWRPPEWAAARASAPGRLHPAQLFALVQRVLDSHADAVLACDGGEIGQWAQACLDAPHRVVNGVAGAIGVAVPFAIGARLAVGDAPVVAVTGDGAFGFHVAEYDTAMRHALPFLAVVGNDARWNAEYQIQLRSHGPARARGCLLRPMRYDAVAAGFGAYGEHVDAADALGAALERARTSALPACIDVAIEGLPAPVFRRPH